MLESVLSPENLQQLSQMVSGKGISTGDESAFQNILNDLLTTENTNNISTEQIIAGDIDNLAAAMVDMSEADLTLQFTMQVRNKIVEAYQEIMRMQV